MKHLRWLILWFCLCALYVVVDADERDQVPVTATPQRVSLPTPTSIPTDGATPTVTPTPTDSEDTEIGDGVFVQALETAGDVNVRLEGDINAERVGSIRFGDVYQVTGRYFLWYEIIFDASPTGRAFVFGDLVEVVSGDVTILPDLSIATSSAPNPALLPTESPGGTLSIEEFATLTANARVIEPSSEEGIVVPGSDGTIISRALPTYTYPADLSRQTAVTTRVPEISRNNDDGLSERVQTARGFAPIMPILVLAGMGLLGLILSSLRR